MSNAFFVISEFSYAYIICKGMRTVSGNRRTNAWLERLCYIGYALIVSAVYQFWNIPFLTLTVNILLLFLISLNYDGKFSSRIFQIFSICIFFSLAETIALVLTNQAVMDAAVVNEINIDEFTMLVTRLIQFLFVVIAEKVMKKKEDRIYSVSRLVVYTFIVMGSVYLETVLFTFLYQEHPDLAKISSIVIFMLNISVMLIYDMLGQQYRENQKNNLLQMRNLAYENELKIMKENETIVRLLRHDMKNHFLAVEEQLKKGDIEGAKQYLGRMLNKVSVERSWIQTGNWEIDSFINYKFAEAQKWGISCSVQAKIPENLPMDGFSIACILGNLLDNAVTAASDAANPEISVILSYIKQNLYLRISNSYQGELLYEFRKLITRQPDRDIHGYGLESVRREVERCSGNMKVEHDERNFSVSVMLPAENAVEKDENGYV